MPPPTRSTCARHAAAEWRISLTQGYFGTLHRSDSARTLSAMFRVASQALISMPVCGSIGARMLGNSGYDTLVNFSEGKPESKFGQNIRLAGRTRHPLEKLELIALSSMAHGTRALLRRADYLPLAQQDR